MKSCLLALYAHLQNGDAEAHSKQLLDEEHDIQIIVALKKVPEKQHNKPIRMSGTDDDDTAAAALAAAAADIESAVRQTTTTTTSAVTSAVSDTCVAHKSYHLR